MIEIAKIWTEGIIKLSKINDIFISQTVNSHGTAKLSAYVDSEVLIQKISEDADVEIWGKDTDSSVLLFCGKVRSYKLISVGAKLYELDLFLISHSISLDRKRKRRSFQDVTQSYADIAKIVAGDSAIVLCDKSLDVKPFAPVIQYDETDWEFLIRIASHINETISGDILARHCQIHLGNNKKIKLINNNYRIIESGVLEQFYVHKECSQNNFIYYVFECEEMLELGNIIISGGKKLCVFEKKFYNDGEYLKRTYYLGSEMLLQKDTIYNKSFIGRVIKGEVLGTENETLKIKMEIDEKQDKNTAYSYDWRPETGNLMYCMPQIGTTVSLYFGDEDERKGYIINCIRTNSESCQDMDNPDNKIFTSEHGKRMILNEEQICFLSDYNDGDSASIMLQDKAGITFYSNKNIKIVSDESITVESKDVMIEGAKEVLCIQGEEADDSSSATLSLKERLDIIAKETWLETRKIYHYPNILDTIEEVKRDSLLGKVLVGIGTAVCIALIGAVFVTFGAAILATAGIASAAIASLGYTAIFTSAFIGGAAAGITGVGVEAYKDSKTGNTEDYGDYMSIAAANSAASALTGGIAAPVNECIELANFSHKAWLIAKIGVGAGDSGASYILSQSLLGDEIDTTDLGINAVVGGVFNINGHVIDEFVEGEREMGEAIADAYSEAYMSRARVGSRAYKEYYELLEQNKSVFNGGLSENISSWLLQMNNPNEVVSNISSNILKSTRSMLQVVGEDDSLTNEDREKLIEAYENDVLSRKNAENQYYVVRGAVLRCKYGTHTRRLDLNSDNGMRTLRGEYPHPYVNEAQCVVGEEENIKFFGICNNCKEGEEICVIAKNDKGEEEKIVGIRCEPDLLGDTWMDTKEDWFIQSEKLVSGASYLMCKHGGCIIVETSGEEYCGELDDGEIIQ